MINETMLNLIVGISVVLGITLTWIGEIKTYKLNQKKEFKTGEKE